MIIEALKNFLDDNLFFLTVNVSWEYEDGTEWKRYEKNLNVRIEKANQRNKVGSTILKFEKET